MTHHPLVSKLVTYGEDRATAIERMRKALDTYRIAGVEHNISFLRTLMDHKRFISGDISTKFIQEEYPEGFQGYPFTTTQLESLVCAAAVIRYENVRRANSISGQLGSLSEDIPSVSSMVVNVQGKDYDVEFEEVEDDAYGQARISFFNTSHDVNYDWQYGKNVLNLQIDSSIASLQVLKETHNGFLVQYCGQKVDITAQTAIQHSLSQFMPEVVEADYKNFLLSPMPGKVISLNVSVGDKVAAGQQLAVIEAMKMQNVLRAETDRVVKSIECKEGDNLSVDAIIIEFEA